MAVKKNRKDIHPKITHCLEMMLVNRTLEMEYYGEYAQLILFHEVDSDSHIKTAGVNFTKNGMNFYYNRNFIDSLSQEQVNFVVLHEIFHLIFQHSARTLSGGYSHDLSNISQDCIINSLIIENLEKITKTSINANNSIFISIPTDELGNNSALFVPKDYEQEWIFEILYFYLKTAKEESTKRRQKKNDDKVFKDLFCEEYQPINYDPILNFKESNNILQNTLINHSFKVYDKYINNFIRLCILYLNNFQTINIYGHSCSVIDENESSDFNLILSQKRAELFKNVIIDKIDNYMDSYGYCLAIFNHEDSTMSIEDKIDYIIKYEEITNSIMFKQRKNELIELEKKEINTISHLYKQYRFAELSKLNIPTLQNICINNNLTVIDIKDIKKDFKDRAKNYIITEGKADTDPIIVNELDENKAILNIKYNSYDYKRYETISDSKLKRNINRRITYKFPDDKSKNGIGQKNGYGKNGYGGQECYDLDTIFDDMSDNDGQFMDQHICDEVSAEMRERISMDAHNRAKSRMKNRGVVPGHIQAILDKLIKKKKDHLKEIKRGITYIKGYVKTKSFKRINRRNIVGLKGKIKYGSLINVIIDVSGSMDGYIEKTLNFVFRNDIEINLIQADTEVKQVLRIKSMRELQKMKIVGFGGTELMPAVNFVADNLNNYNTVILTDGYCDTLDLSSLKGKVLLITCGQDVPISNTNNRVRHIKIED